MTLLRDSQAMLAAMEATLETGDVVFCTTTDALRIAKAANLSLATFHEAEGVSLILPVAEARAMGFPCDLPMRRITLRVFSSLEGIGLTAAVAGALTDAKIPCNMVAAFHHDHVFVPAHMADAALDVLRQLQDRSR
jgi:uncharacterized protein